jgi:hypothetical protein
MSRDTPYASAVGHEAAGSAARVGDMATDEMLENVAAVVFLIVILLAA